MSLPMYKYPTYTLEMPVTKKKIKYRPFLVRDEKNLLLAQQSEEEINMLDTLKGVITNCIIDKNVNIDELPIFDIEYIFSQLRVKSVGENVELIFTCQNTECKEKTKLSFKIDPKLVIPEGHTNKLELFDDVGVVMKYANTSMLKDIQQMDLSDPDAIVSLIAKSIDYIYDAESVHHAKDEKFEDLVKFVESLPRNATEKIKKFFETTPKLQQKVEFKCPKCEHANSYDVEGIESFF
jgi:hypothetical protein